jgi:hypothetical protein
MPTGCRHHRLFRREGVLRAGWGSRSLRVWVVLEQGERETKQLCVGSGVQGDGALSGLCGVLVKGLANIREVVRFFIPRIQGISRNLNIFPS